MSNSLHYHSALRAVIGEREMISPERLAEIRALLPADEAFQLKYVIVPLSEGIEAQRDLEVISGHLHNVATMSVNGMDPEILQEFLSKHENRVKALPPAERYPSRTESRPSPAAETPHLQAISPAAPRSTSPSRRSPSRSKSASRTSASPLPAQPRLKTGDRLRSRDARRSRMGVIEEVQGENIRVKWGKGISRVIKIQRILQEHRYDLLPAAN